MSTAPVDTRDPHRIAPAVPLAVLPMPGQSITPWRATPAVRAQARTALADLDRAIAAARHPDRRMLDPVLPTTVASLGALATRLAAEDAPVLGEDIVGGKLIHRYFGVRHAELEPIPLALYAVLVLRWCLADLPAAALDVHDVLAELLLTRAVVSGLVDAEPLVEEPHRERFAGSEVQEMLDYLPDHGDAWERWVVAHHGYLLANLLAADAIRRAADLAEATSDAQAAVQLTTATVHARGMTATMIHSAVLPGDLYDREIRPTMAPPAVPKPLTGAAFTEHRAYHGAIRRLLDVLDVSYAELHARSAQVANARDGLLHVDLLDLERHITMGADLVGPDLSLVQHTHLTPDQDSAIGELRRMRDARVARYGPFTRAGQ